MASHGFDRPESPAAQPRRAWLMWLSAAGVILLICLCSLYFGWRFRASNRLDQLLASYRAAGQPTTLADLQHPPIAEDQNAGLLYINAGAAVQNRKKKPFLDDLCGNVPFCRQNAEALAELIANNAQPLASLRRGRSLESCDFGVQFTSPAIDLQFPHLSQIRTLAKLGSVSAIQAHISGDDSAAFDSTLDLFALSRAARTDSHTMIQYLIGVAIESLACRAIESIQSPLAAAGTGSQPDSGQLRALIQILLAEDDMRATYHHAMLGERAFVLDYMMVVIESPEKMGAPAASPFSALIKPALLADVVHGQELITQVAGMAEFTNVEQTRKKYPEQPSNDTLAGLQSTLSSMLIPSYLRSVELYYRALAERRMAACALAIRLYEREHGQLPATLTELVPQYLPAVPLDPMAADNRPISYHPDGEAPILYSVGDNGRDDGGHEHERGKDSGPDDHAFYLHGNRPPPPFDPSEPSEEDDQTTDEHS